MSEFWMIRDGDALRPWGQESADALKRVPHGKPLQVEVLLKRNGRFLALYWVLCRRIANAVGASSKAVDHALKLGTGNYSTMHSKTHGVVKMAGSIAFANMKEADFREFFDKCLVVIETEWGIARPDMLAAVSDIIRPDEELAA